MNERHALSLLAFIGAFVWLPIGLLIFVAFGVLEPLIGGFIGGMFTSAMFFVFEVMDGE